MCGFTLDGPRGYHVSTVSQAKIDTTRYRLQVGSQLLTQMSLSMTQKQLTDTGRRRSCQWGGVGTHRLGLWDGRMELDRLISSKVLLWRLGTKLYPMISHSGKASEQVYRVCMCVCAQLGHCYTVETL